MKSNGYTKIKNNLITSSEIDSDEFRILAYLISLNRNGMVFPSISTIAINISISKRTIIRRLKALEEKGYLIRENRTVGNGKKVSNSYLVNEEAISKDAEVEYTNHKSDEPTEAEIRLMEFDWLNEEEDYEKD